MERNDLAALLYTENHEVPYYECDVTNRMTPAMILNTIILISEHQNIELGLGIDFLDKFNLGWVVVQYEIDIERMPVMSETIAISTQATSYNRFFAFREFWIKDSHGETLVHVKSTWVTMDRTARKMVSIPEAVILPYQSEAVKRMPRLKRPTNISESDDLIKKPYQVRYYDIDGNGHVNNAHYLEWLTDVLPMDFLTTHEPKQISLRFENEVQYGHMIESQVTKPVESEGSMVTHHQIVVEDTISATATIEWRSRVE